MGSLSLVLLCVLCYLCVSVTSRDIVYNNQFAVHIPEGKHAADAIAEKYGFRNLGQIGSLKGYYLLEHNHIHKRSIERSDVHSEALNQEKSVRWVAQQHERQRFKRDFSEPEGVRENRQSDFGFSSGFPAYFSGHQQHPLLHSQYSRGIPPYASFPDPLYKEQWYLNGGAKDGFDMNVEPAWKKGYSGKGIVVSILDDGIQTNHPDIARNYDPLASTDINDNDDDPMPRDNGDNKHGTRCAGEVAAVAYNEYCGVGVAYNASIGGVRMLDGTVNDAVEARALGLNPDHVDIYSASWGPEDDGKTVDGPGPLARRAFIYGITNGRKGKGSIFVWASGNGGRHTDSCNCDGYTNSIFTLSISSATQGGQKPWYLEECSSTLATTYSSGTPGHDKSVATVDMDGKLRPDHICTVEHTGTSASAPLAAGICALALEANPDLTWRDLQYLVVMSSRPEPLEKESGWAINGVNRKVSHKFGYGLMDAGGIVNLAEQWITVPPQHICKSQESSEERVIPGGVDEKLKVYMDVDACAGTLNEVRFLEHVQCKISLRFFPRGNLKILLTSPMGTTSVLLFERPRDVVSSNFDEWPFLSVHFWGERAEGRWTLEIINSGSRRINQPGVLKKWQLLLYGTDISPVRLRNRNNGLTSKPLPLPAVHPTPNQGNFFTNFQNNFPNIFFSGSAFQENKVLPNSVTSKPNKDDRFAGKMPVYDNCDSQCDQGCFGAGPTMCRKCKHHLFNSTCMSSCPKGTYVDRSRECFVCHDTCQECVGSGIDECLSCVPSYLMVTDMSICMQECPHGYFQDSEHKQCISCAAHCSSCESQPNHCTSCEHNLVLFEGKCYAACPSHTFETEDYNCQACHSSCSTCMGPADNQCVTCSEGKFFFESHCLDSCPVGYLEDNVTRECLHCQAGCARCNGVGCEECEEGWDVARESDHGQCVPRANPQCVRSEFFDGNICRPCHMSCGSCSGASLSQCLSCPKGLLLHYSSCIPSCPDGYYGHSLTARCIPCPKTCTKCSNHDNCTQCSSGLKLEGGSCQVSCSKGFYSDRGVCRKCYVACHTCSGPRKNQCVTCPTEWQLAAGECHPECPQGFFHTPFGCQKCHRACATCNGDGPLDCTSCHHNFMLDGAVCMECTEGQYYDSATQLCKQCHSSCRSCLGPDRFSCKSCLDPLQYDMLNSQCVPCCSPNENPRQLEDEESTCCHCHQDTGHCKNPSPAGKRRIGVEEPIIPHTSTTAEKYTSIPVSSVIQIGIIACVSVAVLFTLIFAALQVRSSKQLCWKRENLGYEKLTIRPHYRSNVEKVSLTDEVVNSEEECDEETEEHTLYART